MPFIAEDGSGVPGATSYISVEDADAIHDDALYGDAWFAPELDDNKKQRALMYAARVMDDLWKWRGERATTTQGLDFPLLGTAPGVYFFPFDIKRANAEVALWLLQNPPGASGAPAAQQTVEGLKLGPMEITLAVPNDPEVIEAEIFPSAVARYLRQYGSMGTSGTAGSMRLRR